MNAPEMKDMALTRLLVLVHSSIYETTPDPACFAEMDVMDWNALYRRAAKEGVIAVAYDSMIRLPADLQPPRMLKLVWGGSVDAIERKYAQRVEIANELAANFRKYDMRMLLIKGIGISRYHPSPSHREFGDLDIYLFGLQKDGDLLLQKWGASKQKKNCSKKHTVFIYKGLSIENHAYFSNVGRMAPAAGIDDRLKMLAAADHAGAAPGAPLFPSPDFMALHFISHALEHFSSGTWVWRFFCDWAVFLHGNKGKWDVTRFCEMLPEGYRKVADAFTSIAVSYLGVPPEEAPPFKQDQELESKIFEDMSHPRRHKSRHLSSFALIAHKYRGMQARRWKYETLSPGSFPKVVARSVFQHLCHPRLIWNLGKK
jgi:hypothetical protein